MSFASEKIIPETKSFLHEAYCFRNIIKCTKCNEPINKNEIDIHENEAHKLVKLFNDKSNNEKLSCQFCRRDFEAKALQNHVSNCAQRPKMCQFCNTEVSTDEYHDHVYQCGSRTRKCSYCNKSILIRGTELHVL